MTILYTMENVEWAQTPNQLNTILSTKLPIEELVTSAFVLLFKEDKLLLTKVDARTWDIPGGHKEIGETPIETAIREVLEETNVAIQNVQLVGYDELLISGNKPVGYKYPFPRSYLAYYTAEIQKMNNFTAENETSDIGFFSLEEAKDIPWVKNHLDLCKRVLDQHRKG